MEEIVLNCELREKGKKSILKNNRKIGKIPAVLYNEKANILLYFDIKDYFNVLKSGAGENAIFQLVIGDEKRAAMIKEKQLNPVTDKLIHLDFMEISMKKLIEVDIPIKAEGTAKGVVEGGILEYLLREIKIKCFPTDIPKHIPIDVTNLGIGKGIHVRDLKLSEKLTILTPPEQLLINIVLPKEEEKPAETIAVEPGAAEPEIIKKGKKEEEGTAEGAKEGVKPKEEKTKTEPAPAKDKKK